MASPLMVLLAVQDQLQDFRDWLLALRPALCAIAGVISITRIAFLWMAGRDKRAAVEETIYWIIGLAVFFIGLEVIEELSQRWSHSW